MARLIRRTDWAATSLGSPEFWPAVLVSYVNMILAAPLPMELFWGDEMIVFYNDAMAATLTERHPRLLGTPGRKAWSDAWPTVGEQLESAYGQGTSMSLKNVTVLLFRGGRLEQTRWDYSYSPVFDSLGEVARVLVIAQEVAGETQAEAARQMSEQRLDLAMNSAELGMWSTTRRSGWWLPMNACTGSSVRRRSEDR